jgi:hypothetical protein
VDFRRTLSSACLLGLVVHAGRAQATALRGQVLDATSGTAVAGVEVRLVTDVDTTRDAIYTDSSGYFQISNVTGTAHRLLVRRVGYVASTFGIPTPTPLQVELRLRRVATLETMHTDAAAKSRVLVSRGFYERQRIGFGVFYDSATLAARRPASLLNFLRPYLRPCTMIFVDGLPNTIQDLDPSNVAGIEIFASNLEAPEHFQNPLESGATRCGSIVVWRTTG